MKHADVKKKVKEEIKAKIGGSMTEARERISIDSPLEYLESVCMEALRLTPPVKISKMYEISKEIRLYDIAKPVMLPKGTKFLLNFVAVGRDIKDRKEPLKFNPDLTPTVDWPMISLNERNCPQMSLVLMLQKMVVFMYLAKEK